MQQPRLPYPCLCPRSGTRKCPDRPSTLSYTKFTVTDYYIILSFQDMGGTYRRHFSDTKNAKEKGGYRNRRVPTIYIVPRTVRCSCCCSSSSLTLKAANVAAVDICRCGQTRFQSFILYSRAWAVHHGNPNLLYSPFFFLLGPFKRAWAIKSKPVLNPCCLAALLNKAYLKALHFANGA